MEDTKARRLDKNEKHAWQLRLSAQPDECVGSQVLERNLSGGGFEGEALKQDEIHCRHSLTNNASQLRQPL